MPRKRDYQYIVVTKGEFIPGEFGIWLNQFGWCQEVHFESRGIPKDGFYIRHNVITVIKTRFSEWKNNFEFYVREGQGDVRPYGIPKKKDDAHMKKAKAKLKELKSKKQAG